MKKIKLKKLFTMVELILVIAIIAFLTVTATVVLSQWLSKSRDSRRMADIAQIEKGIETAFIENNEYPLPDSYVNITASGTVFNYQGKFCDTATEKSNIKATPKDPSDSACYTYETTTGQNKFQLMAFMENTDAKIGFNDNVILAVDYTKRIPSVKGDKLGILIASGINQPVEDNGTGVDVVNTSTELVSYFNQSNISQGTGKKLFSSYYINNPAISNNTNLANFDDSLIAYWDMETTTSTGLLKDLSKYGHHGLISGGVVNIGDSYGSKSRATKFGDGFIRVSETDILDFLPNGLTLSIYTKRNKCSPSSYIIIKTGLKASTATYNPVDPRYNNKIHRYNRGYYLTQNNCSIDSLSLYAVNNYPYVDQNIYSVTLNLRNSGGNSQYKQMNTILADSKYHHIVGTVDGNGNIRKMYYDGVLMIQFSEGSNYGIRSSSGDLFIGINKNGDNLSYSNGGKYYGEIDDIKIYNRVLSESEVLSLYNSIK